MFSGHFIPRFPHSRLWESISGRLGSGSGLDILPAQG